MARNGYLVGACLWLMLGACRKSGDSSDAAGPADGMGGSTSTGGVAGSVSMGGTGGSLSTGGTGGIATAGTGGVGDAGTAACQVVDGGSMTNSPYLDLDLGASGFTEHEGQTVFLVTRADIDGVLGAGRAKVMGGAFAFHFPKGYKRATDQEILWLLDADGDGVCDDSAGDQTGYFVVNATDPTAAQSVVIALSDNHVRTTTSGANLCNAAQPFGDMLDMNITATGFDVHEGRAVHLLTRTPYNGAIFGSGDAVVAGGGFAFHFPRGFERFTYQEIFFFVDIDGDGTCAPGTDYLGYAVTPGFNPTQNVPLDMQIMDNHMAQSGPGVDVCVVANGCQVSP